VLIRLLCESVGTFSDLVCFCRRGVRSVRLDSSPDSNMSALAERTIEIALHFQGDDGVVEADLAQVFTAFLFRMGGVADVGQGGIFVAAERKDCLVHVD